MVDTKHKWKAWVFLAPALLLIIVFTVYPIINTVLIAFQNDYSPLALIGGAKFEFGIKLIIALKKYNVNTG